MVFNYYFWTGKLNIYVGIESLTFVFSHLKLAYILLNTNVFTDRTNLIFYL